jgi:glutamate synthase domain-containing protein 3
MVTLHRLTDPEEAKVLKGVIYKHLELTESVRAKEILADWNRYEQLFWKVAPQPPANLATPVPTPTQTGSVTPPPPGAAGDGALVPGAVPEEPAKA